MCFQINLDFDGAFDGIICSGKFDQKSIADGFDNLAIKDIDLLFDQVIMELHELERTGFVLLHHTAETDDIREHYCGEPVVFMVHYLTIKVVSQ